MKSAHLTIATSAALLLAVAATPAIAQKQPTPEQRIGRLERQLRQLQRQVFPKGQPADTAGFSDEPAATQAAVQTLGDRLDAIERQLADIVRTGEENGQRLGTLEADLARLRADQDERLKRLETAAASAASPGAAALEAQPAAETPPPPSKPKVEIPASESEKAQAASAKPAGAPADPAEAAYDEGYQLWKAGKYDAAIESLKSFAAAFPGNRRVSWANNLRGRALLDKGQPRAAAEVLLANYRSNPKGERAQDSLYYLGQSLMRLGQPGQACKAYAELEDVYRDKIRPELKGLLPKAKAAASCS